MMMLKCTDICTCKLTFAPLEEFLFRSYSKNRTNYIMTPNASKYFQSSLIICLNNKNH